MLHILELAMSGNYFWHAKHFYKQIKGVTTRAKYVSTVANIFSKCESEEIYR